MKQREFIFETHLRVGRKSTDLNIARISGKYYPDRYNKQDGHSYDIETVEVATNVNAPDYKDCTPMWQVMAYDECEVATKVYEATEAHLDYRMSEYDQHEADIRNDERYEFFGQDTDLNPDNN